MKRLPTLVHVNHDDSLWRPTTDAIKLGTLCLLQYIGRTLAKTRAACGSCALLPGSGKPGEGRCFAWTARTKWGLQGIQKKKARLPEAYHLVDAIKMAYRGAKVARFGMIGNPSWLGVQQILAEATLLKSHGIQPIGYEHLWDALENQPLKDVLLASCETFKQGREASSRGWIVSMIVPKGTAGAIVSDGKGTRYLSCPANKERRGRAVSCSGNPLTGQAACGGKDGPFCQPKHPIWQGNDLAGIALTAHDHKARPI